MTASTTTTTTTLDEQELPRWSVADVHESLDARSFSDAFEGATADVDRLVALLAEAEEALFAELTTT